MCNIHIWASEISMFLAKNLHLKLCNPDFFDTANFLLYNMEEVGKSLQFSMQVRI